MPGWKFVIGGGEKIKNQEPQNASRGESANSRGGNNGGNGNGGMQNNDGRSMTNAVAYQPHQGGYGNQGGSGGNQMMAYSNMMAGDYPSQSNGGQGGYGMFMPGYTPQNRQMGFTSPGEWEDRGGRGGSGMRGEEYYPDSGDVEARRRRSRRTGRFIRGEGEGGPEMHHRDYDDDKDGGRGERRGSYRKHEREDEGGETEHLRKKIKKLEKRLEEGEEAQEHLRHLKKEVSRLKEALEEMKEEKGKGGDEEREKRDKKKKERKSADDDDDPVAGLKKLLKEGVEGKEFLKHLPGIFQAAFEVIANPPQTWPEYLEKGDYSGIYVMEAKELMKAIEQYKAGQKGMQDVLKEMKHTGAALIQMYANLLQQMEEKK